MVGSLGKVFVLKTTDKATGILALLKKFDLADYSGKRVALKANFNSADSFPASPYLDTMRALVDTIKESGSSESRWLNAAAWATLTKYLKKWVSLRFLRKLGLTP